MIEDFLNIPIENVGYHLRKNDDTYLVDEEVDIFDIKAKYTLIESIGNLVSEIKIVFEKDKQELLFENLVKQYGNPTHYYDDNSFLERELGGNFTNWKIKRMLFVPYGNNKVEKSNNNIWDQSKYIIKLLNFSTIRGFGEEYVYLVYARKK